MRAPAFWQDPPGLLARALAPLGAIYGAATARRMARPGEQVAVPVVCVGDFVAGGAGKTPTAIALAKMLRQTGERVAFLSRGYGGEAHAAPLLVDPARHSARAVGDEPLLLARVAPCWVGADRVACARAAIEACASVLVMDDGLQNPSLAKDFSICVIDGEARFGNGLCVPAGPLRAPLAAQAPFVDALVVIGGEAVADLASLAPGRPMFTARLQADAAAASKLIGRPVLAFAGIARPQKFYSSLRAVGAQVARERAFADHYRFRPGEIAALEAEADAHGLLAVTTEKDRMRFPAGEGADVLTLPVKLGFDDAAGVAVRLSDALAARRKGAPTPRAERGLR